MLAHRLQRWLNFVTALVEYLVFAGLYLRSYIGAKVLYLPLLCDILGCSLKACNKEGQTALHIAASHGHTQTMKVLTRYGADVNWTDNHRKTAMHLAISQCQHKMRDKWATNIDGISVNREIEMLGKYNYAWIY